MSYQIACKVSVRPSCTSLTLHSFGATALITIGALWFIYRRMLGVRKKVILGMRDDLRSKNVQVSDGPTTSDFAQADNDERSWENPWARDAITGPHQSPMSANQGVGHKQ